MFLTDGLNGLSNVTSQPVSGLETGNMSDSSSGSSSSSGSDFSSDSDTDQSDSEVEPNKSKQIFSLRKCCGVSIIFFTTTWYVM